LYRAPAHDTRREGLRLGLITASATWLWVAIVDAVAGQPFHTFGALGGVVVFTSMHFLLHVAYATAVMAAVHGAARAPSLIIAVIFGVLTLEGAFAMMTTMLVQAALGGLAWLEIFGGSLIATALGLVLLTKSHPLAEYLRRAEAEV
jgi:hypothetical protein